MISQEYRPQTVAEQHEDIDALGQLEHGDIVEIEPGKFCMVKDEESQSKKIELMKIQGKIDYGDLDQSAPVDANVKVCTEILKGISFDEISLSSIKRLRRQNKKLRRMSNISSLDSDTKVFNEIWNAVKQDKFDSMSVQSKSSDTQVFNVLNKSLSDSSSQHQSSKMFKPAHATIHEFAESYPGSTISSVESWSLPENPEASPVYYPASEAQVPDPSQDRLQPGYTTSPSDPKLKSQESNSDELREKCSSRTEPCHCQCDVITFPLPFNFFALGYFCPHSKQIFRKIVVF